MNARRELVEAAEANLAWARGIAITCAVAVGLLVLYPLALVLRAVWRWA
jgi:hypothetical protein